ncbi:hypothetical protein [Nocardia sp. NBC_00511]|uniref:hypothetical protein n=1 Tax=Nocardia sp. NBC_00511 TaxID=2903591 RepID=UPI0030E2916D
MSDEMDQGADELDPATVMMMRLKQDPRMAGVPMYVTYEERQYREHAEARARIERALVKLEAGTEAEQRLAAYMRVQVREDEDAWADYAAYDAGYASENPPPPRKTRGPDRSGLEVAVILLAGPD